MPIITGGNNDDDLLGTAGDDTISGLGGDDTLTGGLGNDSLDGGSGVDVASYAGAGAGVTVDLTLTGPQNTVGAGTDTLTSIEGLIGSDHDDTLTSASVSDNFSLIMGGAGNDTLRAAPSTTVPVVLDGGAGNDTIDANGVTGLSPPVAAAYIDATAGVTVNLSLGSTPQDTIGAGTDTLIGIHNVVGSTFDDHLIGSAQADMFEIDISQAGPSGNDTVDGGGGGDWLNYGLAAAGVTVSLAISGPQATGSGTETISNIANINGSDFADSLTGDAGANSLQGKSGNDTLNGGGGNDTLDGGGDQDTASYAGAASGVTVDLTVSAPQDTVGAGTDTLTNIESVIGSDHDDTLTAASVPGGISVVQGGAGNDLLRVAPSTTGSVLFEGGAGNDTIDASADQNVFMVLVAYGGASGGVTVNLSLNGVAQDTIGAGVDTLIGVHNVLGSHFDDHLTGSAQADVFEVDLSASGASGNDTINGGGGGDWLNYFSSTSGVTLNLALTGPQSIGGGTETISNISNAIGSAFGDNLTGNAGSNILIGGAGNDVLTGGAGNDTLTGGIGDDSFLFSPGNGHDRITDFGAGGAADKVDLSTYGHIGSFEQVLAHAVQSGPDTILKLGDEDQVTLAGVSKSALTSANFTLSAVASPDFGSGADFNGDGTGDVLWRDNTGLVAQWRIAPGSGSVSYVGMDTANASWHIQGAADFDGDGKADVLWRNDSGFVALWLSTPSGRPTYQGVGQVGLNWHVQATGDFNGDGKADVLWRDDNGLTAEWRSSPQGLVYAGVDQVNLSWHVQATADFNGDGLSDILWRNDNGLVAEWLSLPGTSQVSYVGLNSVASDWTILGAGDFNGDGKADILWRQDTGLVGLWQSTSGSSSLPFVSLANVASSWHMQALGDFNQDGKADVLWRNDSGQVALWDSSPGGISFQDLGVVGGSWFIG